ncbi:MAG: histidine phosphatase family protein [Rikenellaceae bacterium]
MGRVYLQRHTKPQIEPQICYGVSNISLHTDYREHHLPEVLRRIEHIKIDRIYSSPLKRCFTLACDIKREKAVSNITIDNRLMELNFGEWEMVHWNDIYVSAEGKAWFDDFLHTPTLGGESFDDMVERVRSFLTNIKDIDEDILVVTHSGVMRAALVITGVVPTEEVFGVEINYGDLIEITL